jgi:hypothetical protein
VRIFASIFRFLLILFSFRIFAGYKFAFVGQMADTPLAIETLVERFGGQVCSKLTFYFSKDKTLFSIYRRKYSSF